MINTSYFHIRMSMFHLFSENIELYGACKRLLEWNNASFHFITLASDVKDSCWAEPWVTMLRGQMITCDTLRKDQSVILWRGKVEIVGTNVCKFC